MMAPILKLAPAAACCAIAVLVAGCSSSPIHLPLTAQGNIQLPPDNHKPSFDLLKLDPRRGYLYVSHASNAALDIVDVHARKVLGSVGGLIDIKGTALTPDPNVVFTSDGGDGTVAVVDVDARKILKKLDVSGFPDDINYDPVNDLIVVTVPTSNKLVLIDRTGQKVLGTIGLPGRPELMDIDTAGGRVFLAINDKDEVVVIDLATRKVTTTYKGCDIKAPTGIIYDGDQGRLFVGDSGAELSVIDVVLDKCLGGVDIGHGADQLAFNSHLHHLYTPNGASQTVSVVDTHSLQPLGTAGTGPEGSTAAADSTTDMVYVLTQRAGIVAEYHDP